MEQFFPEFFAGQGLPAEQRIVAANDGVLELGQHSLHFVYAPMVHWPEVMMTYEATEKILFAADGFGKFGALDVEEEWTDEARRYYIGIVGKYGPQVQAVLKKRQDWTFRPSALFTVRYLRRIWDSIWKNMISGLPISRKNPEW